ncbi:HAD family hydrolase [Macrococcoides caseolyticum]|uniref:HAD family hydrolase n=1 Tax=Macrococcoides caseolyticum TaxID=69966 RepID=UPI001F277108|nr:HAD hydrolase-like protein [Macrococcus caseolyticus]MCE4956634.1 HAD family hydrolase [Macrococcus caseolyticus]
MITQLKDYQPKHPYLVCVDSDGCAIDTMNIKHIEVFGPMIVKEWGLEQYESDILSRWNAFNLYEITRGINRFKGLEKMLTELTKAGITIEGYEAIKQWTDTTNEFSNESLIREIEKYPQAIGLQKALNWSNEVNTRIKALPDATIFDNVKATLEKISKHADIAIVSSANLAAVEHEWTINGLTPYLTGIFAQDSGTKAHCLHSLRQHYEHTHMMMLGDALGDYEAAQQNDVFFYPILANHESTSWETFNQTYLDKFLSQSLTAEDQNNLFNQFKNNLNGGQ